MQVVLGGTKLKGQLNLKYANLDKASPSKLGLIKNLSRKWKMGYVNIKGTREVLPKLLADCFDIPAVDLLGAKSINFIWPILNCTSPLYATYCSVVTNVKSNT